jgi:hypothetical protein
MRRLLLSLTLATAACGTPAAPPVDVQEATEKVRAVLAGADVSVKALEVMAALPTFTCGASRSETVAAAASALQLAFPVQGTTPCGTVTTSTASDRDTLSLSFPATGCHSGRHDYAGTATFQYAQIASDPDEYSLSGDIRALKVDDQLLMARTGVTVCGTSQRISVYAEGVVPNRTTVTFLIDGQAGSREGAPVFSTTEIILTGPGELRSSVGTDKLTLTNLDYVLGTYLPKSGSIGFQTSKGRSIKATFTEQASMNSEVQVAIDDYKPSNVSLTP